MMWDKLAQVAFRLCAFLVIFAGTLAIAAPLAERLILYPFDKTRVAPAEVGLPTISEHLIDSAGETLVMWTAPPKQGQPVIFYLHGNAGNLADRAGRFRRFLDRGYGLVAIAYPGSGGSTESPSEDALIKSAAQVWLNRHELLPLTFLAPRSSKTVVYGESLGAAVAIALNASAASDQMKGAGPADAIILEAPFTSIKALARHHHPQVLPLHDYIEGRWDSLRWASQIRQPLFILHGTHDKLTPMDMGRQIFNAAPSEEKHMIEAEGAGHTDLWRTDTVPSLYQFIDQFALR